VIPNPVAAAAAARPHHTALVTEQTSLTWAELARAASERAGALTGQEYALHARCDASFVADLHAIGWVGAAAAPVSEPAPDLPMASGQPIPAADWPLEQVRLIVRTSGTTGNPRRVPLTTRQLFFSAMGSALRLGHLPSDRWICCLPMHHVGGLSILYRSAWYATTVELHVNFDADRVNAGIDAGATGVSVVPTMLHRLLDSRKDRPFPPSLRFILTGGARTPPELIARCRAISAPVSLTWGMTETASQVATRFPGDLDTLGAPPMPFAQIEQRAGVLHIDGPLAPRGGLTTADRGTVDADGRVHVTGRVDDVIISGGENIDPAEIEAVLTSHPAIDDAAVRGVPDDEWGERPAAWLVGESLTDHELDSWCRERLPGFKVPNRWAWMEELPRNALGKLQRPLLR